MNAAHLHLLLNHVPVLGTIFGFLLLLFGCFRKNDTLCNAGLFTVIVAAIMTIPVYFSGENAEEMVENIIGMNRNALDEHEEFAEITLWAMLMCGAISLATLASAIKKKFHSVYLLWINIIFIAITVGLMTRTAYTGGFIRHSEISVPVNADND